jgi:Fic family protein
MNGYHWRPIEDLPANWFDLSNPDLPVLASSWNERLQQLRESHTLREFNEKLSRQWAIETGIIERVYTLDRGITQLLIEKGIDASLIPHGATNKATGLVVSMIRDQREVIDGLFDFVAQRRELTTSYIKQMHQVFMRNQKTTEGTDRFGNLVEYKVLSGDWKKWPNNPHRPDGIIHEYSPPEQVASEIDRLLALHHAHQSLNVPPEIEAAWFHHRFTQIHPFQDGNGRVARALASLIFLRASWFPLVITEDAREEYIRASESADEGILSPLVALFSKRQVAAFRQAISLSSEAETPDRSIQVVIRQSADRLRQKRSPHKVFELSKILERRTEQRFQAIADEITSAIGQVEAKYAATVAVSDSKNDYWFKSPIIHIARSFNYYANFRNYHTWVLLRIKEERLANILFSFHGLGYEFTGIMAVSALLEMRTDVFGEEIFYTEGPYPISEDIFQFSYQDDEQAMLKRYNEWLEGVIVIGLEQWRKQL